jgi:hypothetical protein
VILNRELVLAKVIFSACKFIFEIDSKLPEIDIIEEFTGLHQLNYVKFGLKPKLQEILVKDNEWCKTITEILIGEVKVYKTDNYTIYFSFPIVKAANAKRHVFLYEIVEN